MVSIAHIVEKIIRQKPFIEESIRRGIISYGGLADMLLPKIEEELGKKVKHPAVMMALRRFADKAKEKTIKDIKFKEQTDIIVRSNLIAITVYKTPESKELIRKIQEIINLKEGDFMSTISGINEITIITNKRREKNILKIVKQEEIKNITKNISSLSINIPENSTETVGLFYTITRSLAWENISIIEIVSTWSETSYILNTKDISKAFDTIKNLIEEHD